MIEKLKKTLYAGLGAAVLSKDAIEKAIGEWVDKGKISKDDAKEFFAKAAKVGEENWEKTGTLSEKLPFATREQILKINSRLKAIEEKLGIATECDCCCDSADGASESAAEKSVPASDAEVVE